MARIEGAIAMDATVDSLVKAGAGGCSNAGNSEAGALQAEIFPAAAKSDRIELG